VSVTEQKDMTPGELCDLFVLRRAYDDEQHGIVRETDDHDISEEDAAMFDHYDEILAEEQKGGWKDAEGD
jgi:hypothetical protein